MAAFKSIMVRGLVMYTFIFVELKDIIDWKYSCFTTLHIGGGDGELSLKVDKSAEKECQHLMDIVFYKWLTSLKKHYKKETSIISKTIR